LKLGGVAVVPGPRFASTSRASADLLDSFLEMYLAGLLLGREAEIRNNCKQSAKPLIRLCEPIAAGSVQDNAD
jgi:hypothetical protein